LHPQSRNEFLRIAVGAVSKPFECDLKDLLEKGLQKKFLKNLEVQNIWFTFAPLSAMKMMTGIFQTVL